MDYIINIINKNMEGRTYTWLSQKTGISKNRISAIVNGKATLRAFEMVEICNALKIDMNQFLGKVS